MIRILFYLSFLFIWISPRGVSGFDASQRLRAVEAFVRNFEFLPIKYSLMGPLFSSPLLFLGDAIGNPHFFIISYNAMLASILLFLLYRWTKSYYSVVAVAFFTPLVLATGNFDSELFSLLFSAIGLKKWSEKKFGVGSIFLAIATANTPALLPATGIVTLLSLYQFKKSAAISAIAPLLSIGLIVIENLIKYKNIYGGYFSTTEHGQKTILPFSDVPGFEFPFILGLAGILFSLGKGLVFYYPGALALVFEKKSSRFQILTSIFFVGMILTYSKWWSWYGGFSWGPRFFLWGAVLSALYLSQARFSPQYVFILVVQAWAAFCGLAFASSAMQECLKLGPQNESLCWYSVEYSPLFQPFWVEWPHLPTRIILFGVSILLAFYALLKNSRT